MHTTVEQNRARKNSIVWVKSKGRSFKVDINDRTESYISEYVNVLTGQVIRKDWRMTGYDWHIFNADGTRPEYFRWPTLTIAKHRAADPL